MYDELKELKYFKEMRGLQCFKDVKRFEKMKGMKSLM